MLRRAAAFLALFAIGTVDAQAQTRGTYPSLAKRPAETRDRLNETVTPAPVQPAAPDPALVTQVSQLQTQATAGDTAFKSEVDKNRASIAAASGTAPMSESWVAAQMAISAADSARYESVAALAGLDTLSVERQDTTDGARAAADLATIDPVRTSVLALVDQQNDTLDALRKTLTQP